ncbi:MAG: hypothetical protein WCI92_14140 [Bacteroidota bacterium]
MNDSKKKSSDVPKPDPEEEVDGNEKDKINKFIRKIELQSLVLKKISKNLDDISGKIKLKNQSK